MKNSTAIAGKTPPKILSIEHAKRRRLPPPRTMKPKSSGPPPRAVKAERLDGTGTVIPPEILQLWDNAAQIQSQLSAISTLKGIIDRAEKERDIRFVEVNFSMIRAELSNAFSELKQVKPYAVCSSCQGLTPEGCTACKTRGFVSEFYWKHCVPVESKELRKKANAK